MIEIEGDNLHCSPLDRPYKARILAYYPESAHGTQFDADAVCMVSIHDANVTLFVTFTEVVNNTRNLCYSISIQLIK